jgi:hypothetical protein
VVTAGASMHESLEQVKGVGGRDQWVSVTRVPRLNRDGAIVGSLCIWRAVPEPKSS